jgi:hypothetical protein
MQANSQIKTTTRFLDPFAYIALLAAVGVFLALMILPSWHRVLVSRTLGVAPDTPVALDPIQLKQELVGALRIDVQANVPTNQWVTYEIQLKDQQGKILASGIKQAWRESGSWAEDGESGSWAEEDLQGGLDVRTKQAEPVTIVLDVLEYSDTSGREIDQPVPFKITVQNGVIDARYLWAGLIGTSILALLALVSVPQTGKIVANKSNTDSSVTPRTTLGGRDRLLRVVIFIKADENAPSSLDVRLSINNSDGEQVYSRTFAVTLAKSKNDSGKVLSARGRLCTFLVLEPNDSYGFHVEVTPDHSVDRTKIVIREGARTLFPAQVTYLKSA